MNEKQHRRSSTKLGGKSTLYKTSHMNVNKLFFSLHLPNQVRTRQREKAFEWDSINERMKNGIEIKKEREDRREETEEKNRREKTEEKKQRRKKKKDRADRREKIEERREMNLSECA